jgi:hypothetical protein
MELVAARFAPIGNQCRSIVDVIFTNSEDVYRQFAEDYNHSSWLIYLSSSNCWRFSDESDQAWLN